MKRKPGRPKGKIVDEKLTLRLSGQLKADLRGLADEDGRSLSQFAMRVLKHYAEEHGPKGRKR